MQNDLFDLYQNDGSVKGAVGGGTYIHTYIHTYVGKWAEARLSSLATKRRHSVRIIYTRIRVRIKKPVVTYDIVSYHWKAVCPNLLVGSQNVLFYLHFINTIKDYEIVPKLLHVSEYGPRTDLGVLPCMYVCNCYAVCQPD
jgi:hypothetical protein